MHIILFSNRHGQVWNFEFQPRRVLLVVLSVVLLLIGGVLWLGQRQGENELAYIDDWDGRLEQQQTEIATLRKSARAELDALTLRIGQLQGEMLRLNGLGERLVSQGDLDKGEFNFSTPPAVGGPETSQDSNNSAAIPDILAMLDQLDVELTDRRQQLSVLESLLMSRSLSERVMPSGRPIEDGWMSSTYGKRSDPFTGKQEFHHGLDFAGKKGDDVLAVADGIVSWSGVRTGYGNLVEINHGNGYVTRYGHNQKNLVKVGDTIKKGQQIAVMGSSGRSTGPHVHFEVLRNGKDVNPSRFVSN